MTWTKALTFEAGSDGATVAVGATSGLNTVSPGAAGTITYDNVGAAPNVGGNLGLKIDWTSSGNCVVRAVPDVNFNNGSISHCFKILHTPSSAANNATIFTARTTTGRAGAAGAVLSVLWTNANALQVKDNGSIASTWQTGLSLNTWYRLETRLSAGTGSTDTIHLELYNATNDALIGTAFVTSTANLGTSTITGADFGAVGAAPDANTLWVDNILFNSGSNAANAGPFVAATPPTAAFTATPTGLQVSFDGTGSSATGATITGYSWNFGDSTSGTGSTATHTYSTAGTYTAVLTVTDSNGQTASVSHSVTVAGANAVVKFQSVSAGGFTVVGAADAVTALNDGLDTTWVQTVNQPNGQEVVGTLQLLSYTAGLPLIATVKVDRQGGTTGTMLCKLTKADGTVVSTVTVTPTASTDGGYTGDSTHVRDVTFVQWPANEVANEVWPGALVKFSFTGN